MNDSNALPETLGPLSRLAELITRYIKNFPQLRKILVNIAWLSSERFFLMMLSLVVGVWVARYLGPSQYGVLNYSLALVSIIGVLPKLGLDDVLVRELLNKPQKLGEALGTTLGARYFTALISFIGFGTYIFASDSSTIEKIALAILSLVFFRDATSLLESWFKSQVLEKYSVWARSIASFSSTLSRLLLIWLGAPFVYFCLTFLLEWVIYATLIVSFYKAQKGEHHILIFSTQRLKELLHYSWPLYFSSIAVTIYMKFDQVILQHLLGAESVGQYSAAVKICEVFHFLPVVIASSLLPSVIKANEAKQLDKFMTRYLGISILVAYAVTFPLAFFAPQIAKILYGSQYSQTGHILRVYCLTFIPIFLGFARSQYLLTRNLLKFDLYCTLLGMFSNVLLCLTLIPLYGTIGAAFSALLAQFIATFFASWIFPPLRAIAALQVRAIFLMRISSIIR